MGRGDPDETDDPDIDERRVDATADGGAVVRLPEQERALLATLPDQLRTVLRGEQDPAGVQARLFPSAYDDEDDDAEYRGLVHDPLAEEKIAAVDVFAATLEEPSSETRTRRGAATGDDSVAWVATLDASEVEAWLSATNDARLALATVLGIRSEEEWEEGPGTDPARVVLWYLGWLQEELLAVLTRGLPSDGGPGEAGPGQGGPEGWRGDGD